MSVTTMDGHSRARSAHGANPAGPGPRRTRAARRVVSVLLAGALLLAALAASALASPAGGGIPGARAATGRARPASRANEPKIVGQPSNVTVEEGSPASFTSTASNTPTVQWELSTDSGSTWTPIAGATSTTYTIAATVTAESGHELRAVFTNAEGSATSKAATLTVTRKPFVTQQPVDASAHQGGEASFEAHASGSPAPTIQWQDSIEGGSFKNVTGATANVLHLSNITASEDGLQARAVFKNSVGETISEVATLHLAEAPVVTTQPIDKTVTEGQNAAFSSGAHGHPEPTEQWESSTDNGVTWTPISGATSTLLTVPAVSAAESGTRYRASFNNPSGSATSNSAKLTVNDKPIVTEQPQGQTVSVGGATTFEAGATGSPTPTVQWESSLNEGATWSTVAGATTDKLTVSNAQLSESGREYRAVFHNEEGTTDSEAARLTVSSTDYRAYGWGENSHGQAGIGSNEPIVASPTPISSLSFVTAVAAGTRHSLGLLADGTVEAWGVNSRGQLGYEGAGSNTPVAVAPLGRATAIAAGTNHSVALLSNGTVTDWGDDENGQLGDGHTAEAEPPVAVAGLSGVTAIAAGAEHTLALLSDGTVMAWGNNELGQLGTGNTKSSSTPVAVNGLSGVTAIAADRNYSMALLSDGTVMTWGDDEDGQLGNNEVMETAEEGVFSDTPVPVEGLSEATAIAAGATHALALLSDKTVLAWGNDRDGELGNGAIEPMSVRPTPVDGLSDVASIAAGEDDSAAILESGTLMTWGMNKDGSLGLGTHGEPVDTPAAVTGLGMVSGVAAGGGQMLAFGEALPTVTGISPASGPTAGGIEVTITGSGLSGATSVHFGANAASSVNVESPSTVKALAPAGTGTVNVTVTTSRGTTPVTSADRFAYVPAPSVKKLSAKGGPAGGGTSVTITGANLSGASEVRFGEAAATITADTASAVSVLAPPGAGTVTVAVTTPGGIATSSKQFEYGPEVESVTPASGPLAGGSTVTITGTGFLTGTGSTKFKFGKGSSKSVQCETASSCTVLVPRGKAPGAVDVIAQAGKGKSTAVAGDRYTYE